MTKFITVDAELFEQLLNGPCKFDCRAKREIDYMAGFDAALEFKEPGESFKEYLER